MKKLFKPILKYYLKFFTKLVLFIYRPKIIVVAGSANQYFFKQAIKRTLLNKGIGVRANPKNFNTEIGLPLTILDLPSGYNSFKNWLPALSGTFEKLYQPDFPKYLVLSLGISDPGDMKYLLNLVKPDIAVLTEITQRYKEGFKDMDELVEEYKYLARKLKNTSMLIFNIDNSRIKETIKDSPANKISFGFNKYADFRVVDHKSENLVNYCVENKGAKKCFQIKEYGVHHILANTVASIISEYVN
jgi:UDP-N-acetylmuramoyl-tripeptide--D-alanyl-D-alanine ligase